MYVYMISIEKSGYTTSSTIHPWGHGGLSAGHRLRRRLRLRLPLLRQPRGVRAEAWLQARMGMGLLGTGEKMEKQFEPWKIIGKQGQSMRKTWETLGEIG